MQSIMCHVWADSCQRYHSCRQTMQHCTSLGRWLLQCNVSRADQSFSSFQCGTKVGGELPLGRGPHSLQQKALKRSQRPSRSKQIQAICSICFPLRLVSPWEQTTAFASTWTAVMSSALAGPSIRPSIPRYRQL